MSDPGAGHQRSSGRSSRDEGSPADESAQPLGDAAAGASGGQAAAAVRRASSLAGSRRGSSGGGGRRPSLVRSRTQVASSAEGVGGDGGDLEELEEDDTDGEASDDGGSSDESVDVEGDAVYDEKDFVSGPRLSANGTVPIDILEFQHSFGYDCQLHSNLCVLDAETLAFVSGDLLHFFRVSDRKLWFRRSSGGAGLGHIAKNPQQPHFAVGEKGRRPRIIVYEWPSMRVVAVLRRGAERAYTYLNYSVDGELLCSMAGPPDSLFTVWDWRERRVRLRAKSSGQDTFQAAFSSHMPGVITSAGSAHVRFWRMAETFTGLKLEGAQGRFGNTEVSDVIGVLAMPDGKVVSGCEWGNVLVWEAGLIKCEVTKKGRKSCHGAPITQFEYFNGELLSLGKDGFVKVWYFETIDLADPPDDDRFVEVEPIFELEVADELGPAALLCMQRRHPRPGAATESVWFAQDGGGGVWQLDLSLSADAPAPRRLLTAHAAGVAALAASPLTDCTASLGREGRLLLYGAARRGLLAARNFPAAGHALLWLPPKAAACGSVLVLACGDGVVRVVAVDQAAAEQAFPQHRGTALGTADTVTLLQALKAHSRAATTLALSDDGRVLASGGEDRVVFLFRVEPRGQFAALAPVGFVTVEDVVSFLAFKPDQSRVVLAGCARGRLAEVTLPETPRHDAAVSYRYEEGDTSVRTLVFRSVKSRLRREARARKDERRRRRRLAAKQRQLERLREENPGVEIDEDIFLADSEPEDDAAEAPATPAEVGAVLWARYLDADTVLLSVAGFDAGYLYTCRFGEEAPVESVAVEDDDDLEVVCYQFYQDKQYLFLGMGDGTVRCARVRDTPGDLADYWSLGMHNGPVTALALSADLRTLFTAGADGNVFMFAVHPEGGDAPAQLVRPAAIAPPAAAEELYGADVPTLEDQCAKAELDRKMRAAAEQMHRAEQALWTLTEAYNDIVRRNRQLPASQQIPRSELELDPRISPSARLSLEAETDLLRRKLAFPLEKASLQYRKLADFYTDAVAGHGIRVYAVRKKDSFVETIRQRRLREEFDVARALVQLRQEEAQRRGRTVEREVTQQDVDEEVVLAPAPVESFLRGVNAFEHKFNARLRRLLDKYHSRRHKRERRQAEWAQFMKRKPDMNRTDPADEELIREAEQTIGDYKLKSDEDYKVPERQVVTTVSKYQQLLQVRKQLDDVLGSFNAEVLSLRQRKADLRDRMAEQESRLRRMHRELPRHMHLQPPEPPTLDEATEYPERQFQVSEEEIEAEMDRAAPSRRQGRSHKSTMEVAPPAPEDAELQVLWGEADPVLELGEQEPLAKIVDALVGEGGGSSAGELRRVDSEVEISTLRSMGGNDAINTPWEDEMRAQRLVSTAWQQRQLVDGMNREVDEVDAAVEALAGRRLEVQRDAMLLRHHLLVLHQELVIIKECEEREEYLAAKVADKELDGREVQNEINSIQNRLDGKAREVLRCQERAKELQLAFAEAVGENLFSDYLKKIFKKKYRPPRATDAGSSDETSSSSSSDEEDDDEGASLESNELGPIRFDDTACPPGCSQELFDLALSLRAQRHEMENEVLELHKDMEHLRREQDAAAKRLSRVADDLRQNERELEEFRRQKQQRLNKVETLVVLRLSQLQHSREPPAPAPGQPPGQPPQPGATQFEQLKNTLVFNTAVLSDLDRRKQQLDDEAKAQRAKHKKNRAHLRRMVIDVRFMRARLRALRDQIEEAQYRKFGCVVDVAELEQALLKRFIWDLRSSADEIRSEFHSLIDSIQADVRAKFVEYKHAIERNTERQNLLLVLVEERNRLMAAASHHGRGASGMDEAGADVEESPFEEDVSRLQAVVRALRARRDALLAEAVRLRQKGPLLPPLLRPGSSARAARPAAGPLTSAYHTVCVADQMPPPPKPWPPACITAIKNPMYLGGTPRRAAVLATPGSGTTRSLAARREAVREQLAAGQDDGEEQPGVRHPQPLQRRSASLDSITAPGFLRADMRDVPAIPSEEELLTAGTAPSEADGDEAEAEAAASEGSVEELYRRVSASDALGAVDGFLERLGSKDAEETLMLVEHRRESTDAEDAEPMTTDDADVSDADPVIDDITDDDSDDGMVQRPPSVPRQSGGSTDEDGPG